MKKLLSLFLVIFASVFAFGQSDTGSISGTVVDASGAVIAGATVTVTNVGTGAARTLVTDSKGFYTIAGLQPATYNISVSATGFATTTTKIIVSVGSANQFNVKLSVSSGTEEVQVVADNFSGIQLENQETSQVVDTKQILEFPTITRNPYDLAALSGNVSRDPSVGGRGVGLNFSGSRDASVDILLDGAENTDLFAVGVGQTVPLDTVQEYRVITSNFGPEYGRASGGVVNVVTKTGTNKLHGTAYEFNRISTFASNDYNSNANFIPKAKFVRNNFGFALGGPIVRDKLFFYNNTEWLRVRSAQNVIALVPTPQLIAAAAPATQAFFAQYGTLKQAINGQTYTVSQVQQSGQFATAADSQFTALGPNFPAFGQVKYQVPGDSGGGAPQNTYNSFTRVDWTISEKTSIFGRYTIYSERDQAGFVSNSPYKGYDTGQTNFDNNGLGSLTHVWGPSTVSTTKVLFSRLNNSQPLGTAPVSPTLYTNSSGATAVAGQDIYFPGYLPTSPGSAIPFGGPQNFFQVVQDVDWKKGNHDFHFGGEYLYIKDNRTFGAYQNAVQALLQTGSKGAMNAFLNGQANYFQVAINPGGAMPCYRDPATNKYIHTASCLVQLPVSEPSFSRSNRYHDAGLYFEDSYKATPRFTLNLGLRWEFYGPQHSTHEQNDANFWLGSGSTIFDRIRNGQVLTRAQSPSHVLWKPNWKQFGPRIGFAYDLTGDGKTSLRAGYGISYERNFNNVTYNVLQNPPGQANVTYTNGIPVTTQNLGPFAAQSGSIYLPNASLRAVDPHIKPAYNQFYGLSVERQINNTTSVGVSYTGERGIHNYSIANVNRLGYGTLYHGDPAFTRNNLQFSNINWRGADGDSYYNGVNVSVKSSDLLHQALTTIINYTYAKSTDNTSSTFTDGGSESGPVLGYLDPFNPGLDHGLSDFDVRHRIVAALIWDIPYAKHTTGLANRLLDGWEISPIYTASTGTPFTEFDCTYSYTVCPRAIFDSRPKFKGNGHNTLLNPATYGYNTFNYLTLPGYQQNEYVNPTLGISDVPTCSGPEGQGCAWPSMLARNSFIGPGKWNLDSSVNKNIKITESTHLQLRAELYNVFNHANTFLNLGFADDVAESQLPDGSPYVPAYKSGRRQLQLGAKFVF
jgi:outer membrane receptor protein involved in Fe transport